MNMKFKNNNNDYYELCYRTYVILNILRMLFENNVICIIRHGPYHTIGEYSLPSEITLNPPLRLANVLNDRSK